MNGEDREREREREREMRRKDLMADRLTDDLKSVY
jgi:hypothetical protein